MQRYWSGKRMEIGVNREELEGKRPGVRKENEAIHNEKERIGSEK